MLKRLLSPSRLKRHIQNACRRFGYELHRVAQDVQHDMITTQEPIIFDIGAYVGEVAADYRTRYPRSTIYCFEPFPASFAVLQAATADDPRIHAFQQAVSSREGTASFHVNSSAETNSLLEPDQRGDDYWDAAVHEVDRIDVPTITLDAFCARQDIPHIDILKIDAQGGEYDILNGARRLLDEQRISLIYMEIILAPSYAGRHPFHEHVALLQAAGYPFCDFLNPVRRCNQLIQADFLFLRSDLQQQLVDHPVAE